MHGCAGASPLPALGLVGDDCELDHAKCGFTGLSKREKTAGLEALSLLAPLASSAGSGGAAGAGAAGGLTAGGVTAAEDGLLATAGALGAAGTTGEAATAVGGGEAVATGERGAWCTGVEEILKRAARVDTDPTDVAWKP